MLYYDPSQKKITAMRKEIAEKDKKIKIALMKAPLVKKLKKEITELEKQLNTFRVKVATSGEIIPLVKTIEDEAQRLDLKVINMSTSVHKPPPPPKPKEGDSKSKEQVSKVQTPTYIRVSFDIDIQGNYDKVEDFIKTLHNLETFIVIEKLNIVSDEKLYPRLESKVVMNVFTKKEVDNSNIDK
ncbi:MAG: Pilus assembly protein, PilO [Candidatus Scalindua rubra]|uniref:Pilus assembly protein, PilO n=1 Tax=Candidatus Scalindua rubra TaxID=1872076 RepID=A0A1E3XCE7_9BACT|nr:MAG: Pilus assembly protein, PilO [Candidatus Scalindua rubra]